jgi:hypothetical protein
MILGLHELPLRSRLNERRTCHVDETGFDKISRSGGVTTE